MLNIEKALELAKLLSPFISDPKDDENILDFIGKIVSSIRQSDTPEVFADALSIMFDYTNDDLEKLSGIDALNLFSDGLLENKIISLCEFYQWLMK
jgi:hypothetical protein